ncbi:MAG: hypothetical protein ACTSVY_11780 [Candidatus Helarchaeota archaeon]
MKVEKETLLALISGSLIGLILVFLGSFTMDGLYLITNGMYASIIQWNGLAAWFFYGILIICLVSYVITFIVIERAQMEVLFYFIVPYIVIEINAHVFTLVYMFLFSYNLGLFLYMHLFLTMVFLLSLPAILFYINYDKWRDPALFFILAFVIYLIVSFFYSPASHGNIISEWIFNTIIISGLFITSIVTICVIQE